MTPDELDVAKEVSKEIIKQTFAPVQEVVRQVGGSAASEVGFMFGDSIRAWRLKRAMRLWEDVQETARKHNFKLKSVAPRLLFSILDGATLEDDEDLHERWVALLANAAKSDNNTGDILPCFPDILRQLTSAEAKFLDKAYDEITIDAEKRRAEIAAANPDFHGPLGTLRLSGALLGSVSHLLIANLERLMLVTRNLVPLSLDDKMSFSTSHANHLYMSDLGQSFVRACRLPRS